MVSAVQSQNVQAALGRIGSAPPPKSQQLQLTIKTEGRLTRPEEFENIIVRANRDGSVVRVKDVARVDIGRQDAGALQPLQRRADRGDRHLPVARRQRGRGRATAFAR